MMSINPQFSCLSTQNYTETHFALWRHCIKWRHIARLLIGNRFGFNRFTSFITPTKSSLCATVNKSIPKRCTELFGTIEQWIYQSKYLIHPIVTFELVVNAHGSIRPALRVTLHHLFQKYRSEPTLSPHLSRGFMIVYLNGTTKFNGSLFQMAITAAVKLQPTNCVRANNFVKCIDDIKTYTYLVSFQ